MGAKRVIVVGASTLALTILALTIPPYTTIRFIDLDLTIVVLFRITAPLLFVGFLLEMVSNWGGQLVGGRRGDRVADFARGLVPIFEFMVPAEILYVLLFVGFAAGVPNGWEIFQVLFSPGLILLPFVFNSRAVRASIGEAYNWLKPQYRKSVERVKGSQVPWTPLFVETLHDFWPAIFGALFGTGVTYAIDPSIFQRLGIWIWVATTVFFVVMYFLKYLKWRIPVPPHRPNP